MGTTAQKLQRVLDTKEGLKDTINTYLGQDITSAIPFKDYETYIKNFYGELPKTDYAEGSNITLENCLKGKLDYEDDKVGYGDTYQYSTNGYQLWKPFNFSKTSAGISFEYTNFGEIKINGIATAQTYSMLSTESGPYQISLNAGTYILSGASANVRLDIISSSGTALASTGSTEFTATFTLTETTNVWLRARIINGTTVNNETIYPMIETGSTAHDWEPYTNGASPNPSYPQPIQVVTGEQEVILKSINYLDTATFTIGKYLNSNGEEVENEGWRYSDYIDISSYNFIYKPNSTANSPKTIVYDINKTQIASLAIKTETEYQLSNYPNAHYIRVSSPTNVVATLYITPITKQLSLGDIELAKIGNYRDYIYKNSGKWYKHSAINKITLNGTENWVANNTRRGLNISGYSSGVYPMLCTHFFSINSWTTHGTTPYSCIFYRDNTWNNARMSFNIGDIENWSNWLATNLPKAYYPLETPTDTEITDTSLINQLEDIYNIQSVNGTTIVEINGNLPMIMKCRALKGE